MTEHARLQEMRRKIASLLAKAKSTEHEAEAEAFMAKARELMERYQLDEAECHPDMRDDPVVHRDGVSMSGGDFKWKRSLYCGLARLYGCQPIICPEGRGSHGRPKRYVVRVVGRESACVTLELMWPFVSSQVRDAGYRIARDSRRSAASCINDVGLALKQRILRMIGAREQERLLHPDDVAARNALVTVEAVSAEYDRLYPNATTRSSVSRIFSSAAQAAEGIGLDRQVGGSGTLRIGAK